MDRSKVRNGMLARIIITLLIFVPQPGNSWNIVGEFGGTLGWRKFEKDWETSEYLFRPGVSLGASVRWNTNRWMRSEIGFHYKTLKNVLKYNYEFKPVHDKWGTEITKWYITGEEGVRQSFFSVPLTFSANRPNWILTPSISFDGRIMLSTQSLVDYVRYDSLGKAIANPKGESDQSWIYKKANIYISPGLVVPLKGAFKKFEVKSSLDFPILDAFKGDTVKQPGVTAYIDNRFRLIGMTFSMIYKIY